MTEAGLWRIFWRAPRPVSLIESRLGAGARLPPTEVARARPPLRPAPGDQLAVTCTSSSLVIDRLTQVQRMVLALLGVPLA
ncbi:MAG: hypothetical protein ACYCST_18820 [Acidimicrobiales bacterium]